MITLNEVRMPDIGSHDDEIVAAFSRLKPSVLDLNSTLRTLNYLA